MTGHHIITFTLLRDVYNLLVDQHITTQIPAARVALRQFLLLVDRQLPGLDSLIDRLRAESDKKRDGPNKLAKLEVHEINYLHAAAVWPAWNTVIGPANRSDDPKDHYDSKDYYMDRFTAGLTAEEAARVPMIDRLFREMKTFVNCGQPSSGNLTAFGQAASAARSVLNCDSPIPYRADMWVADVGGKWRKRRDAGAAG